MKSDAPQDARMDEVAAPEPPRPLARRKRDTPRTIELGEDGAPRPHAREKSHCMLTIIGGGHVGSVLSVGTVPVVLGRGEPCELQFDDASISFVHAQIERGADQYLVRD